MLHQCQLLQISNAIHHGRTIIPTLLFTRPVTYQKQDSQDNGRDKEKKSRYAYFKFRFAQNIIFYNCNSLSYNYVLYYGKTYQLCILPRSLEYYFQISVFAFYKNSRFYLKTLKTTKNSMFNIIAVR